MTHTCQLNDPWPTGHPLPEEVPAKLQGFPVGAKVLYTHRARWGQLDPELDRTVWFESVAEQPATVLRASYVWSPGECRAKGGYRRYDWKVIRTTDASGHTYEVVVDDADLTEVTK